MGEVGRGSVCIFIRMCEYGHEGELCGSANFGGRYFVYGRKPEVGEV